MRVGTSQWLTDVKIRPIEWRKTTIFHFFLRVSLTEMTIHYWSISKLLVCWTVSNFAAFSSFCWKFSAKFLIFLKVHGSTDKKSTRYFMIKLSITKDCCPSSSAIGHVGSLGKLNSTQLLLFAQHHRCLYAFFSEPAYITVNPKSWTLIAGQSANFTCEAAGTAPIKINW